MIEFERLHDLTLDVKIEVEKALATLSVSGVWEAQIEIEQDRLLNGPSNEPTEELAQKINLFRIKRGMLLDLNELGNEIGKAIRDGDTDSAAQ
jgi:hypothetical protein